MAIIPVATSTGEGLDSLPRTAAITTHAHLGDQLLPYAAAMLVLLLGLMLVHRARHRESAGAARRSGPGTMAPESTPLRRPATVRVVALALTFLAVVAAAATAVRWCGSATPGPAPRGAARTAGNNN